MESRASVPAVSFRTSTFSPSPAMMESASATEEFSTTRIRSEVSDAASEMGASRKEIALDPASDSGSAAALPSASASAESSALSLPAISGGTGISARLSSSALSLSAPSAAPVSPAPAASLFARSAAAASAAWITAPASKSTRSSSLKFSIFIRLFLCVFYILFFCSSSIPFSAARSSRFFAFSHSRIIAGRYFSRIRTVPASISKTFP